MNFQVLKESYEKVPVEHYPHNVSDNPIVSVCVQTYNHEPYIKECLESILMQETDFPFEILLGEDVSKDGTREICIEYAQKFPRKIRLFLHHRENNIQIGGQPTGRFNFLYNLYSARGKYIALCEGDDYWTDPLKLQKQLEFMEENEDCSLIHTENSYKNEITGKITRKRWKSRKKNISEIKGNYPSLIITDKYMVATCTALIRSKILINILIEYADDFDQNFMMGDNQLWFHLARLGSLKYLEVDTATYRRHSKGATAFYDLKKRIKFIKNSYWQKKSMAKKYGFSDSIKDIDKKYLKNLSILYNQLNNKVSSNKYFDEYKELDNVNNFDVLKLRLIFIKKYLYK